MTVLVVGATGATGRLLVRELLDRGVSVRVVVRDDLSALPSKLTQALGNLLQMPVIIVGGPRAADDDPASIDIGDTVVVERLIGLRQNLVKPLRLARIEQRGLASEGGSESEARERAWQIAAAIMDNAREIAAFETSRPEAKAEAAAARAKRARIKAMLADARSGRYRKKRDRAAPLKSAFSPQTRFHLGCLLLAWFTIGGKQAGLFEPFQSIDPLRFDLDQIETAIRETAATATGQQTGASEGKGLFELWSIGSAGLLLAMSAFVSGWRMTPPALVATTVILFGPLLGIPSIGPLPAWVVSLLIGIVVYIPGVIWGEEKQE